VAKVICEAALRCGEDVFISGWTRLPGMIRVATPSVQRRLAMLLW
jgi:hypothetical protein